jgi:hypothetical protein
MRLGQNEYKYNYPRIFYKILVVKRCYLSMNSCRFYAISANVLELCLVRFETVVYRNAPNNDTMFNGLLQRKITVFREATLFAKALMSARIRQRCCYRLFFFRPSWVKFLKGVSVKFKYSVVRCPEP